MFMLNYRYVKMAIGGDNKILDSLIGRSSHDEAFEEVTRTCDGSCTNAELTNTMFRDACATLN